jgi:ABC-type branched-subunit amino acid transport system substrate-binding protein
VRRGPILCVCAFAALTAGVGSCAGSASSTVSVSGKALTIYASQPAGLAGSQDIIKAESLAFRQNGGRIGQFTVQLRTLTSAKVSDSARTAIEDPNTIAYIGELQPGASADSLGITNAQDILQVSPTDTAVELTQGSSAVPGAPGDYYEAQKTYGRTFARVVPTSAQEAQAQVQEMTSLHVKTLYMTGDGSAYAAALQAALRRAAGQAGITVSGSPGGADGAFYAGSSGSAASRALASIVRSNPKVKLFAPSALAWSLGAQARPVYVSTPGYLPSKLPAAAKQFVSAFKATYGHPPVAEAIFGYAAVQAVLAVVRQAGSAANDRSTVVRDFFKFRTSSSALGAYSIDPKTGDVSLPAAPFVFNRLQDGDLVPFKFVAVQG